MARTKKPAIKKAFKENVQEVLKLVAKTEQEQLECKDNLQASLPELREKLFQHYKCAFEKAFEAYPESMPVATMLKLQDAPSVKMNAKPVREPRPDEVMVSVNGTPIQLRR